MMIISELVHSCTIKWVLSVFSKNVQFLFINFVILQEDKMDDHLFVLNLF